MVERKKKQAERGDASEEWIQYHQRSAQKAENVIEGNERDVKVVKLTNLLREREIKIGQIQNEADQSYNDSQRNSVEKKKASIVGPEGMSGKDSPRKAQKHVDSTNSESEWRERDTYEPLLPYGIYAGKKADNKHKKQIIKARGEDVKQAEWRG